MNKTTITWKIDMFGRVIFVCDANTVIIESIPALSESYGTFKLRVSGDKALMEQLFNEENGYAKHKDQVWEDLTQSLDGMCAGLRAYAKKQGNIELQAQGKFTPSVFLQMRSSEAVSLAKNRLVLLNTHVADLANYNVTPAKVTNATNLLKELEVVNPKPTGQRSVNKAIRQQLVTQVKETTVLLDEEIDELVVTLTAEQPLFVEQYFNARRIQHTGIRHEKPEGTQKTKKDTKQETKKEEDKTTESKETPTPETNPPAEGQPNTDPPADVPPGGEQED